MVTFVRTDTRDIQDRARTHPWEVVDLEIAFTSWESWEGGLPSSTETSIPNKVAESASNRIVPSCPPLDGMGWGMLKVSYVALLQASCI